MSSEIKQFYSKSNVLLTGGTGLFGKLIIQKLLRTCDINGIYLLVREKGGKSTISRMEDIFEDPLFDVLKQEKPEYFKKVHLVNGDCSLLNFGVAQETKNLLWNKTNVVFHCAALLNMDAKLKDTVNSNVRGSRELLEICRGMRNLKSIVFVSTAFSNCNQLVIEEKIYEVPITPTALLTLVESIDEKVLNDITPGLINVWPNNYCFSKAIAENLYATTSGDLPVGIFRPSMVMPTYSDPVEGWISNMHGPIGSMLAAASGVLRVMYCKISNMKFDIVPADLCINALICSAWEIHQKRQKNKSAEYDIPVYNYTAGKEKCIDFSEFARLVKKCYEYPVRGQVWAPMFMIANNIYYYNFLRLFLHIIPGYIVDAILYMTGRPPQLIQAYRKIDRYTKVLEFFTSRVWDFKNKNIYSLWDRLNHNDKELFPFNMNIVEHETYFRRCCLGMKIYLLRENMDNAEAGKRYKQRLCMLHNILKKSFILLGLWICYKLISLFVYIFK